MKWLKRLGKITAATALILFCSLFIYANWNPPRLAHQASPAYYATFDLKNSCSEAQKQVIESELSKVQGVSAVTVNLSSKIAVVAYNPTYIDDPMQFQNSMKSLANVESAAKKWEVDPSKPQCPAHGFLAWLDNAK